MKKLLFITSFIFAFSISVFAQSATVIGDKANLRGTPNEQGKVVNTVSRNTSIEVIKQSGVWFLVQTAEYVGWMHGNTIKLDSALTVQTVENVVLPRVTRTTRQRQAAPVQPTQRVTESRGYIRGPRGGCYYINSRGNKTYVSRSLCN